MDLAGPDAKILVDTLRGPRAAAKALIKSIRVSRDQFAPEVHFAGELSIEILTQPGIGPIRGNVRSGFYDSALDGRNPLVGQRGPAQSFNYGIGLSGTLISQRAVFQPQLQRQRRYATPVQYATDPAAVRGRPSAPRAQRQHLLLGRCRPRAHARPGAAGEFQRLAHSRATTPASATSTSSSAPMRPRTAPSGFHAAERTDRPPHGAQHALVGHRQRSGRAIGGRSADHRRQRWFTTGGAQLTGGTNSALWFNSDLDYVRGRHSVRTGIALDGTRIAPIPTATTLALTSFESLEAFEPGRPRSYTRRIGDPNISYFNLMGGIYVQDDIRVRRNLSLSRGCATKCRPTSTT